MCLFNVFLFFSKLLPCVFNGVRCSSKLFSFMHFAWNDNVRACMANTLTCLLSFEITNAPQHCYWQSQRRFVRRKTVRAFMVNTLTVLFRLGIDNASEHCYWQSHRSFVRNKNVKAFMVNSLTVCSISKEFPRVAPTLASQCAWALLVAIPREFCSEQKC